MEKFYSRLDPEALISVIMRRSDLSSYRKDACPSEEYIQVCGRKLAPKVAVKAHKHTPITRKTSLTQEVWIILEGAIKVSFYDLDNTFLLDRELESGDCMVLFRGGHALETLRENTLFYEIKSGPYYGRDADKEDIND